MAKSGRNYSSKGLDPLDEIVNLLGAAAMGVYARHKVKSDYKKGYGDESIKAATTVFGLGAMRGGTVGKMGLGGLWGTTSAIHSIEREEEAAAAARRRPIPNSNDRIDIQFYGSNDNRYAWRLNCEDGSAYGLDPENFETRNDYNAALKAVKAAANPVARETVEREDLDQEEGTNLERTAALTRGEHPRNFAASEDSFPGGLVAASEGIIPGDLAASAEDTFSGDAVVPAQVETLEEFTFCRVSRLDNGKNLYYLAGSARLKIGDIVLVPGEAGETEKAVVLSIERHTAFTAPQRPEETLTIIGKEGG